MNDNSLDEKEIDLLKLFKALWHKAWLLVLSACLCGAIVLSCTYFFVDPIYEAGAKLYVNNSSISVGSASLSISSGDISAAKSLVETYIVILQTRQVLDDVIDQAELDMTYEELKEKISAAPVSSTEVFEVLVTDTDPNRAEKIANTIADILPAKISDIVDGSSMRIVDYAIVPSEKSGPSLSKNTLIGALVGFLICSAFIVVSTMFDNVVRDENYLLNTYPDIPVLAIVPDINMESGQKGNYSKNYYKNT